RIVAIKTPAFFSLFIAFTSTPSNISTGNSLIDGFEARIALIFCRKKSTSFVVVELPIRTSARTNPGLGAFALYCTSPLMYEGDGNENSKPPTSLFISAVLNEQSPIFLLQLKN